MGRYWRDDLGARPGASRMDTSQFNRTFSSRAPRSSLQAVRAQRTCARQVHTSLVGKLSVQGPSTPSKPGAMGGREGPYEGRGERRDRADARRGTGRPIRAGAGHGRDFRVVCGSVPGAVRQAPGPAVGRRNRTAARCAEEAVARKGTDRETILSTSPDQALPVESPSSTH